MKFLENFNFTSEEISYINENFPENLVKAMDTSKKLVSANLEYLKKLGVSNYKDVFMKYYDMFLMDNSNFEEIFSKYDKEDLIDKILKNVNVVEFL